MSIFVFLGPTLPVQEAEEILDGIYLPPAKTGDVYRVAQKNPEAIAIIDGYFDRMPTIWHKEILWAMKQGIHVFGSSSMGALRAAELHAFGMEGVGQIFEDFHHNRLEDDDEVAVAHTHADDGLMPLSVAMVDIRATLKKAQQEAILGSETHDWLLKIAKDLHYPERNYKTLITLAKQHNTMDWSGFETWLEDNQVYQKRNDAIQLLELLQQRFQTPQESKQVSYPFHNTVMWIALSRQAGQLEQQSETYEHIRNDWLLDEVRLNPEAYYHMMRLTLIQLCARYIAQNEGWTDENLRTEQDIIDFMTQRQLDTDNFETWLQQNDMTQEQFETYLTNYLRINQLERNWHDDITTTMPEILRLSGHYTPLAKRAQRKQQILAKNYMDAPELGDIGLSIDQLYRWYFVEYLKLAGVPTDISAYARTAGFSTVTTFERALIREYCYKNLKK